MFFKIRLLFPFITLIFHLIQLRRLQNDNSSAKNWEKIHICHRPSKLKCQWSWCDVRFVLFFCDTRLWFYTFTLYRKNVDVSSDNLHLSSCLNAIQIAQLSLYIGIVCIIRNSTENLRTFISQTVYPLSTTRIFVNNS